MREGGMAAIPTETVYGLAALATDEDACRSIFSVKGRPLIDPLIVHVAAFSSIPAFAEPVEGLDKLAKTFWPGPLTVILPKRKAIPDLVTAGKPSVAIRIPDQKAALSLLAKVDGPLAAPSANPFGYVSPTRPEHVADTFGEKVPFVLDGGSCRIGVESTILDMRDPRRPGLLRPGAIGRTQLEECLGRSIRICPSVVSSVETALAPGTMERHYSPGTPLFLFESEPPADAGTSRQAVVFLQPPRERPHPIPAHAHAYWWSESGDLTEMAQNLFSLLRRLDAAGYVAIHCQLPAGEEPLAVAVRDRLRRAAAGK
ncbi:MAG: threonylcarbamoyl-AMP synthase [Verrucomicrobia bacterium]|nr:threonylcarbamoyl-AMP synthase [Verrucomicrobiota bacterium]